MGGYLHLMEHTTHMHGLTVYVKERRPFAQDLPLENSVYSYLFSTGFISPSVLLLPLWITFFLFMQFFILLHPT